MKMLMYVVNGMAGRREDRQTAGGEWKKKKKKRKKQSLKQNLTMKEGEGGNITKTRLSVGNWVWGEELKRWVGGVTVKQEVICSVCVWLCIF